MFMSATAHSTSYELESRAKFELVVLQFVQCAWNTKVMFLCANQYTNECNTK